MALEFVIENRATAAFGRRSYLVFLEGESIAEATAHPLVLGKHLPRVGRLLSVAWNKLGGSAATYQPALTFIPEPLGPTDFLYQAPTAAASGRVNPDLAYAAPLIEGLSSIYLMPMPSSDTDGELEIQLSFLEAR